MRALVLHEARRAIVEERPIPSPAAGEVLIRVGVCGVCGSDAAEFDHGPVLSSPPVVLGHEFAGNVEALGAGVDSLAVGARVVCGAGVSCGECRQCQRGRTNLCSRYWTAGLQRDGGLAEFVTVPASVVLDVSQSPLPMDTLGLAQPMSIAVHAVRRSGLAAGDTAVIVGAGGIGVFLVVAAAAIAERVVVVDLDPERLGLGRRLGAQVALDAREGALDEQLRALDLHPDVIFEVSGSASGLQSVLAAARPGSTIVPVGIQRAEVLVPLAQWTVREYTVVGTNAHVFAADLADAVGLLESRDDWTEVAPAVLPLDRAVEDALVPLSTGTSARIKTLIDPSAARERAALHTRS